MSAPSSLPQIVTPSTTLPAGASGLPRSIVHESRVTNHESRLTPLHSYFNALFAAHGSQHWWPGRTRFEIIVGAILTQNTSWKNVERAVTNLRRAKLLTPAAIRNTSFATLAQHLRPSGYYRQKTQTLKNFVDFLYTGQNVRVGNRRSPVSGRGSLRPPVHESRVTSHQPQVTSDNSRLLSHLFSAPTAVVREQLLALRGIGPETADSILLYAGNHPVFVVDAYSRRILERHAIIPPEPPARRHSRKSYEQLRAVFESQLPRDSQLFNEFHALIVHTGKHFCFKSAPDCQRCPLNCFLPPVAGRRSQAVESTRSQGKSYKPQITAP